MKTENAVELHLLVLALVSLAAAWLCHITGSAAERLWAVRGAALSPWTAISIKYGYAAPLLCALASGTCAAVAGTRVGEFPKAWPIFTFIAVFELMWISLLGLGYMFPVFTVDAPIGA